MGKVNWEDPEEVKKYHRERRRVERADPEFREKENKRNRKYYKKNSKNPEWKDKQYKKKHVRKHMMKNKAIKYTGGLQCHNPDCVYIKYEEPLVLQQIDFHHVITENKTASFSDLFENHKWERCKEEIDNCEAIPLCANCHRLTFSKF